ncbi:MAG: outer membrane protein assembly factor BamE [Rhodocyclaceae bacterium]|nr:outer membrane protein assembly factor BamE [Rhodocyclaceae bacterium]
MRQIWMAALVLALTVSGCSVLRPYRADLRQGNYIDEVAVNEVKPGMTRDQVRYLLGTPLVVDTFRPDRWDYVYEFISGRDRKPEMRKVTVFFEQDVVARVERGEGGASALSDEEQALRAKNRVIDVPEPAKK